MNRTWASATTSSHENFTLSRVSRSAVRREWSTRTIFRAKPGRGCGFRIPRRLRAHAINGHDRTMKLAAAVALVATVAVAFVSLWVRERRARTVFPANQASSLMNPLRRYIQSPDRTVAQCGIALGDTVLELGPGPGYFTAEAARAAGAGGRVVCIDLQPGMVRSTS